MRPLVVLLVAVISTLLAGSDSIKTLVFPTQTSTSYVELVPQKPLNLRAYTMCMRVATELSGEREVILFAYRTRDYDELNLWRELDGRLGLYMSGEGIIFGVPELGPLQTHLCVTWDSTSGAVALFMNGRKSLTKIYKKGHTVQPWGQVILGQDPDNYVGGFDEKQCFIGEILDVNMWDSVLPDSTIEDMFAGRTAPTANVINWGSTALLFQGNVHIVDVER
uniref:Pentraxin family member n=1 Tax=Mola mola TaxID=94237 RepID=A0A3Q4BLP8_MOLML